MLSYSSKYHIYFIWENLGIWCVRKAIITCRVSAESSTAYSMRIFSCSRQFLHYLTLWTISLYLPLFLFLFCYLFRSVLSCARLLVTDKRKATFTSLNSNWSQWTRCGALIRSQTYTYIIYIDICMCGYIAYLELTENSHGTATRHNATFDWKILFSIWFSACGIRHKSFRRKAKTFIVESSGISINYWRKKAQRHQRGWPGKRTWWWCPFLGTANTTK